MTEIVSLSIGEVFRQECSNGYAIGLGYCGDPCRSAGRQLGVNDAAVGVVLQASNASVGLQPFYEARYAGGREL